MIDFTDIILKDVIVTGLANEDIRKEVLGWVSLGKKSMRQSILSKQKRWHVMQ